MPNQAQTRKKKKGKTKTKLTPVECLPSKPSRRKSSRRKLSRRKLSRMRMPYSVRNNDLNPGAKDFVDKLARNVRYQSLAAAAEAAEAAHTTKKRNHVHIKKDKKTKRQNN